MNITKRLLQITGFMFLTCASHALIARPFIVQNNSAFTIYYRPVPASDERRVREFMLTQGASVTLDTDTSYSIRSYLASHYDLPIKDLLGEAAKSDSKNYLSHMGRKDIPMCLISSGIPYGWSFQLGWQETKR